MTEAESPGIRPRTAVSRRALITSSVLGVTLAATGVGLTACSPSDNKRAGADERTPGAAKRDNPLGVDKGLPLEIVMYSDGYGSAYGEALTKLYNEWAGGNVATVSATRTITQTLQPRFEDGEPPGLINNAGPDSMPTAAQVDTNQLADLQPLLESPSIDDPEVTVGDLLVPEAVDNGSFDGVFRTFNYARSMWGFFYDTALFERHGWEQASTWADFLELLKEIKGRGGIAPFIHPGRNLEYLSTVLTGLAVKHGGNDVLLSLDNLKPDAWTNDSVVAAAEAIEKLVTGGYIKSGAEKLDYRQAQSAWLRGEAAIVPCGSWLEHEMRDDLPDDFAMAVAPFPSLSTKDALPLEAVAGGADEVFMVGELSPNKQGAMQFLRLMMSEKGAQTFTDTTGSLIAAQGVEQGVSDRGRSFDSVVQALAAAGKNVFSIRYAQWYVGMRDARAREMIKLATGRATADQFCAAMQAATDRVAGDPAVKKYLRS